MIDCQRCRRPKKLMTGDSVHSFSSSPRGSTPLSSPYPGVSFRRRTTRPRSMRPVARLVRVAAPSSPRALPRSTARSSPSGAFRYRARVSAPASRPLPPRATSMSTSDAPPLAAPGMDALRAFAPALAPDRRKGQAGKIAVVGGCAEYTGAPYFAAISALRVGADLAHVFCATAAAPVIKAYSPELIVHPYLVESTDLDDRGSDAHARAARSSFERVRAWLSRVDAIVVGPGLGRDDVILETARMIIEEARALGKPIVVDADGMYLVTRAPDAVRGYSRATLTPNANELARLAAGVVEERNAEERNAEERNAEERNAEERNAEERNAASGGNASLGVLVSERLGGATVVCKGAADEACVANGGRATVRTVDVRGSNRRCGGQGDVLAGTVAVFQAWRAAADAEAAKVERDGEDDENDAEAEAEAAAEAAAAACSVVRLAAREAFAKRGRSMVTGDLIEELGGVMERAVPSEGREDRR